MEVLVLASGSSGNAAVIHHQETTVLVDMGISVLALKRRLEVFGHTIDDIDAVVLTHEHQDHVRGLEVLNRRHPKPVWATAGTWSRLDVRTEEGGELSSGTPQRLGSLTLLPVATSHDACEPVAFVVESPHRRLGLCTDTGVLTALLAQRLQGCEALLLETNHDADLLRHGPYPWPLKQRIASRHGHLANHQSEEACDRLRSLWLCAVIGLHLSEHNNSEDLAVAALRRALGHGPVVEAVSRHTMLRLVLDGDDITVEQRPVPPSRRSRS